MGEVTLNPLECALNEAQALRGQVDALQAENAKLLEIIADLEELLPKSERLHIHETANAIADDNAKLRKLVRDIWKDYIEDEMPHYYDRMRVWDYWNDDGEIYNEDELPHYQERMRELGVEVNG